MPTDPVRPPSALTRPERCPACDDATVCGNDWHDVNAALATLRAEVARLTRELTELRTRSDAPFNCINCERGLTQDTWKWLGGRNIGPFCDLCHAAIEAERDAARAQLAAPAASEGR